jgi:LDH2 family malate/lactate/ureidoglycolate dehydrogenase
VRPVRVVGITGAPGVGKTSVAERLGRVLPGPTVTIDLDHLAAVWPWREDDALLDLMAINLRSTLPRAVAWGARTVVVSGVVLPGRLHPRLRPLLDDPHLEWHWYGLRARATTLHRRIASFHGVQDAELRESMAGLDALVAEVPSVVQVLTDDLTVDEVVAQILRLEQTSGQPAPMPPSTQRSEVQDDDDVRRWAVRALTRRRVPGESALALVERLMTADLDGVASHGLIRVAEYADAIDRGEVDPMAQPETSRTGQAWLVDGKGAGGWRSHDLVVELLSHPDPVVTVRVRRAGHLGRLGDLARLAVDQGRVVVGAATFSGTGQKVAATGTAQGTLATNPILVAFPGAGTPIVVDTSTSAWSEGAVRVVAEAGGRLPDGVLVAPDGSWCHDPMALYDDDPARRAALAALGRLEGTSKGYALSVAVELLGGALGGGLVSEEETDAGYGGNSALIVSLDPTTIGHDVEALRDLAGRLERHVSSRRPLIPDRPVRLPGGRLTLPGPLRLSEQTRRRLRELAEE